MMKKLFSIVDELHSLGYYVKLKFEKGKYYVKINDFEKTFNTFEDVYKALKTYRDKEVMKI